MTTPNDTPTDSAEKLATLTLKIESGERLTNAERAERQGLIFNHSGKCGQIITGSRPLKPDTANLEPVTPNEPH